MRRPAFGVLLALCVVSGGGCGSSGSVSLDSIASPAGLRAHLPAAAYAATDSNIADIYMTDLPGAALEPGAPLTGVGGQFVHLHIFLAPKPGLTPIAKSACSVTVRHVVIADGEVGVYGGGGFLDPDDDLGDQALSGSMDGATCRLVAHTTGFVDRLGASEFSASFTVPRNDAQARTLAARLGEILATATPVPGVPAPTAPGPGAPDPGAAPPGQ